ncbi:unnamed protein product [Paramecium octaurelia]|uniref:Uncharacterized protein n=1 Tax=Paramecium octaurelia TaxID=43137 RepID=A0A8S1WYH7_PAROT|nr:unnamed protein product [Paramecium octaurelia]
MDYINFLKEDNAVDQVLVQFNEQIDSTFQQQNLQEQIEDISRDLSKPLVIDEKVYYTVHQTPWHLVTQKGGCCIIKKEGVLVIASYDETKGQNPSRFRRRMSLLDKII